MEWTTTHRFSFDVVEDYLSRKLPKLNISLGSLLLVIAISTYALTFSYITILRHHCFQSSGWDLGIFMQSLYTTGFHGKLLGYTLETPTVNPYGSFLGAHFSPILFLLVPLYRLAPFAETLLILQSVILAMGAFGLYAICYYVLSSRFASLSLAISYLLYTPLHALNWFDFHVQAFIPLLFFLMYYFYLKKEYKRSFLFLILLLSTVEMMPVLVFPFGLYCLLSDRKDKRVLTYSLAIMCTCIAWFLSASLVKAYLNPMHSTTYGAWHIWGSDYIQMLTSVVTKPVEVLTYFLTVFPLEKTLYFLWLTAPLFFLPLIARKEFILLTMPWIALTFISVYTGYFAYQYAAFVAPQIFISTVYGLKRVSEFADDGVMKKALIFKFTKWILMLIIITFILIGPFGVVPQTRQLYIHGLPEDNSHKEVLRQILQLIPSDASVYTSFHIAPHLANRLELYAHAVPDKPPDYIVIDLNSRDSSISLDTFGGTPIMGMRELLGKYNYTLIVSIDGILIYSLTASTIPILEPITISFNYKNLTLESGMVIRDDTSMSGMVLTHRLGDRHYAFWHGPCVALPQGRYEITYRVKHDEPFEGHLLTLDITSNSGATPLTRKYVYDHDVTSGVWNDIKLEFSIDEPKVSIEFRGTYASNATTHYLDFVELKQLSPIANITSGSLGFNHMDLDIVNDEIMANGVVMHEKGDPKTFLFGLYTALPLGEYTVKFWLRLDAPYQGHVFSLDIEGFSRTKLTEMGLSAEDFNQTESWQCFSLNFTLSNVVHIVEIRGICVEDASTSFSYLELLEVGK
jgi:uncharacterized membrane protein